MTSRTEFEDRLRRKLDPTALKDNLARAGLVLATYELLKSQIIGRVRDFFVWPDDLGELGTDSRYETDVLGRSNSPFSASCEWLVYMDALTAEDLDVLTQFQQHRHEVAHELVAYLVDPEREIDLDLVAGARRVLRRLGVFWGRINVDSDPDYDHVDVADEDITSAASLLIEHLIEILGEPRPD